jgi:membrane dipeptidase
VALITITHFFNKGIATSPNSFPFFPDATKRWPNQGLSEFGSEVIKEMEELGIIVDVTHASSTAIEDILRVATKPLVSTHSSVRTLGDHPYSLFDEHVQEIARRGGIVGVILAPWVLSNYRGMHVIKEYGSLRDVVRTIRYVTKICGTHKRVGIGSDFAGYITGPKEMTNLGEIDKLRKLLLIEFDNDEAIVEDIMANNVIEFLQKNWRSGI